MGDKKSFKETHEITRKITRKYTKLSVLIIFLFMLMSLAPTVTMAASLYFSPAIGSYVLGKNFTVSVYAASADQAMNAVSAVITFPQDKLQVSSLSKTGSIINLWVQEPSFSNANGTINLEGVIFNPGYTGAGGKIIDIIFSPKSQGAASIRLSSGSVLANDGFGTDILSGLGSANYNISGVAATKPPATTKTTVPKIPKTPTIYSETHPDPNKWYHESTAVFKWDLTDDITEVKLLISQNPDATPTISYSPPVNSKTVTNLTKGVWYFFVQFKNEYGWGEVARFRVQIDPSIPEETATTIAEIEGIEEIEIEEIEEIEEVEEKIKEEIKFASLKNFVLPHFNIFITIFIIVLLGFIILATVLCLHYWRIKYSHKKLQEEAERTELILYQAFNNLRKEVTKQVAKLDGNSVLSKREEEIDEELKKAIRNSEKLINGKIKRIKKEINGF